MLEISTARLVFVHESVETTDHRHNRQTLMKYKLARPEIIIDTPINIGLPFLNLTEM